MQAVQTIGETINISREKLLSLVSRNFGGTGDNPNPDEPLKPGPWDPLIRKVGKQLFGPFPEPWRFMFRTTNESWKSELDAYRMIFGIIAAQHPEIFDIIGGGWHLSELNPQPLPPRAAFLVAVTEEFIDRAMLMQEAADAMRQNGEERGIIIVSGKLKDYLTDIDELCPRIPRRFPKPKGGAADRFSAVELLAAGAVFEQNAATAANEELRRELSDTGAKLVEMGIARA